MARFKIKPQKYTTLDKFVFDFDLYNLDKEEDEYYKMALNINLNILLLGTIKHRFKHGLNFIASFHWLQGTGKSLGGHQLCKRLGTEYGNPYSLDGNLCWTPEDLDYKISKTGRRMTWCLDEQRKANYGVMSNFIMDSLADYENQLRKDQANFIYISPELEQHSHFYVFKTLPDEIGIERDETGFPTKIKVMVKSLRHKDDLMLPRGIIVFNAPDKKEWAYYNELKDKHIEELKKKNRNILDPIMDAANEVIDAYGSELLRVKKDGEYAFISDDLLELKIIKKIGAGRFTGKGYTLLKAQLKEMVKEKFL